MHISGFHAARYSYAVLQRFMEPLGQGVMPMPDKGCMRYQVAVCVASLHLSFLTCLGHPLWVCFVFCCLSCRHASKELVQLSLVSLCLVSAWTCGQLGLSEELGAFIAGAGCQDLDCILQFFLPSQEAAEHLRVVVARPCCMIPQPARANWLFYSFFRCSACYALDSAAAPASQRSWSSRVQKRHLRRRFLPHIHTPANVDFVQCPRTALVSICLLALVLRNACCTGAMMSVAERKLVAAGLLLPGHNSSQATSPRQAHGHSSDNNSPASSPTSTPAAAAHHAAAAAYYAKVLGSGAGGLREGDPSLLKPPDSAFSDETLPLNALQPQPSGYFKNQSAGGEGEPGGDPAISMCTNIESIQNVLTALFIASMGLIMSPVFLMHHAAVLLLGTVVVTLVKAAVVTTVVRMFGVPLRLGLAVGLSMAHIGEFSLVLLSMANHLKLLSSQVCGNRVRPVTGRAWAQLRWLSPCMGAFCDSAFLD